MELPTFPSGATHLAFVGLSIFSLKDIILFKDRATHIRFGESLIFLLKVSRLLLSGLFWGTLGIVCLEGYLCLRVDLRATNRSFLVAARLRF